MPQRKNRNKKRQKSRKPDTKVTNLLQQILDDQTGQMRGISPEIKDVQRMIMPKQHIFTCTRTYSGTNITASATVDQLGALAFALASVPDSTEFTALFDQYRIIQAIVKFIPTTTGTFASPLYSVIDYDDNNVPTSLDYLHEYATLQMTQAGAIHERVLTPRAALSAYTGTFTGFGSAPSRMWMDVASAGILYYGLKYYLPAIAGSTTSVNYVTQTTLVMQFKYIR